MTEPDITTTYEYGTVGDYLADPRDHGLDPERPAVLASSSDALRAIATCSPDFEGDDIDARVAILRDKACRALARRRGLRVVGGGGDPTSAPKGPPGVGSSEYVRIPDSPCTGDYPRFGDHGHASDA